MKSLIISAIELAQELQEGRWGQFEDLNNQPVICLKLINELQSRVKGYELSDYVKAITYAINRQQATCIYAY